MISLSRMFKDDQKARAKSFSKEHRELVRKYRCDWNAYLEITDNGIIPSLRIIDVTKILEAEQKNGKQN